VHETPPAADRLNALEGRSVEERARRPLTSPEGAAQALRQAIDRCDRRRRSGGLAGIDATAKWLVIAEMLRLQYFWRDSGPIYAWPPPEETLARQRALGMLAYEAALRGHPPPAVTPEQIKAQNEERQRDGERVIAQYKERDRQRQERELKKGREAMAREAAESNRRHGWPY
jgi:hypothetical protein